MPNIYLEYLNATWKVPNHTINIREHSSGLRVAFLQRKHLKIKERNDFWGQILYPYYIQNIVEMSSSPNYLQVKLLQDRMKIYHDLMVIDIFINKVAFF